MSRALSLPHEHGGYLTIAAAAIAGTALAPAHLPSLAFAVAVAAAFFARAPVEAVARRRAARFDAVAVAPFVAVIVAAAWMAAAAWIAPTVIVAGAIIGSSAVARRWKQHRSLAFETAGMAALGASAALVACAGHEALRPAIALGVVIAVHAGAAVPLVRAEVRPAERARLRSLAIATLACAAVGAVLVVLIGEPRFAIGLVPRALHALVMATTTPAKRHPNAVGARESLLLAAVIAVVLLAR